MGEIFCKNQLHALIDPKDKTKFLYPIRGEETFFICAAPLPDEEVFECPYRREDIRVTPKGKIIAVEHKGLLGAICRDYIPIRP